MMLLEDYGIGNWEGLNLPQVSAVVKEQYKETVLLRLIRKKGKKGLRTTTS